jgi:mono/diheme cytochrome c family protein
MSDPRRPRKIAARGLFAAILIAGIAMQAAHAAGDRERGAYVALLSGCKTCHTDIKGGGAVYAGGRTLTSPYGTFHVPNITPDRETGIGGWSEGDFIRAMTRGVAPDGSHYYPSFPYTSYTRMKGRDIIDLKAYLDSLKPVRNRIKPHDLNFPYNMRFTLGGWKLLFFTPGPYRTEADKPASWNRGAYIVNGPGHCGECHTARNFFGASGFYAVSGTTFALAGTRKGPEGKPVPNITPHRREGLGDWNADQIVSVLEDGTLPDGDTIGDAMADVVEHGSAHWRDSDRRAVAEYLLSLPPRKMP